MSPVRRGLGRQRLELRPQIVELLARPIVERPELPALLRRETVGDREQQDGHGLGVLGPTASRTDEYAALSRTAAARSRDGLSVLGLAGGAHLEMSGERPHGGRERLEVRRGVKLRLTAISRLRGPANSPRRSSTLNPSPAHPSCGA